MGRLYMATDDHTRAILHYKMYILVQISLSLAIRTLYVLAVQVSNPEIMNNV